MCIQFVLIFVNKNQVITVIIIIIILCLKKFCFLIYIILYYLQLSRYQIHDVLERYWEAQYSKIKNIFCNTI